MRRLVLILLLAVPLFATERGLDAYDVRAVRGATLLWFAADAERGRELWRTDGTPAGTFHLDLGRRTVVRASAPAVIGDRAYVLVQDGYQTFLYESDGTQDGTREVMYVGTTQAWDLVSNGKMLFFVSRNWIPDEVKLWRSDGTVAGTKIVTAILSDDVGSLFPFPGGVVFKVRDILAGRAGKYDAWSSDGIAVTKRLPGMTPFGLVAWKGLIFAWPGRRSDGTVAGTFALPVPAPVDEIVAGEDAVFLRIGTDIWRSDGSVGGTFRIHQFPGKPAKMIAAGKQLFVIEDLGSTRVTLLGNRGVDIPGQFIEAAAMAGQVWLRVRRQLAYDLWRTDGFTATRVAENIGAQSTMPMTELNGRLIFAGNDGIHGREPWATDGIVTQPLANVNEEMTFRGRVIDAETRTPLPGTIVTAWLVDYWGRTLLADATAGADGTYVMEGMPDGDYVLQALPRAAYTAQTWPQIDCPHRCGVTLVPPTTFRRAEAPQALNFALFRSGRRIEGRVVDQHGRGVEGLPVVVASLYEVLIVGGAKTDADGRYSAGVPFGEWTVYTSDRTGWSSVVYDGVSCAGGCPIGLSGTRVPANATNADFVVRRFGTIRGRVLSASSGKVITDVVQIAATRSDGKSTRYAVTSTGEYELVLPDGTWMLTAQLATPPYSRSQLPEALQATPGRVTEGFDFHFPERP